MRSLFHLQYNLVDGTVIDTNDPQQMGRVKVWCPAIDGDTYEAEVLPWANYVSPLAGQVHNFPGGSQGSVTGGLHSYGFWAIPKMGANVIVAMLYGDVNRRFYIGCIFDEHGNRSLPVGRNRPDLGPVPLSDTLDPVEPQTHSLNAQFDGKVTSPQARSRGAYERSVGQGMDKRDGTEGYQKAVQEEGLDPQTYCLSTPGRHSLIFQDNPTTSRLRLKTADGHQVIFDDANERIYISTADGKTWLEMDNDGHIHMYGAASVSISAGKNINMSASGAINMVAGTDINIAAAGHARISACNDLSLSGSVVNIESKGVFNILAAGSILATGSNIHLNGPKAATAPCAAKPDITPNHEPWERPPAAGGRGPNWKP